MKRGSQEDSERRIAKYVEEREGPRAFVESVSGYYPDNDAYAGRQDFSWAQPGQFCYDYQESVVSDTNYTTEPSVWDNSQSSLSGSSKPSTASRQQSQTVEATIAFGNMSLEGSDAPHYIPCLLEDLNGCVNDCSLEEFEDWYSHSLWHFGSHGPPKRSLCIFCEKDFAGGDRRKCWRSRMLHVFQHFVDGYSIEVSQPDFELIKYLKKHHVLSTEQFEHAMRGTGRENDDEEPAEPQLADYQPLYMIEREMTQSRRDNELRLEESRHSRPSKHSRHPDKSTSSKHKHGSSSSYPKQKPRSEHRSRKIEVIYRE